VIEQQEVDWDNLKMQKDQVQGDELDARELEQRKAIFNY
jgi:hypothetical protein